MWKVLCYTLVLLNYTSAQLGFCPPKEVLLPCTCAEHAPGFETITCSNIPSDWVIKAVFDAASPYINSTAVFFSLRLVDTTVKEIPAGTFQNYKFEQISIFHNLQLQYISPDAFNIENTNYTTSLEIQNTAVENAAPNEYRVFEIFNKFPNLVTIQLSGNQLTSIPANAFGEFTKLWGLFIGHQNITTIGANAFSKLKDLEVVEMVYMNLTSEGIDKDAFNGMGVNSVELVVDFQENPNLTYLEEEKFKTLLDTATKISVGAVRCIWPYPCYYYQYLDCDEKARWICNNLDTYQRKLLGYWCEDIRYTDIFSYCGIPVKK